MMNKERKQQKKLATTKPRGNTVAPKLDGKKAKGGPKRPKGPKGPHLVPKHHPLMKFFSKWTSLGSDVRVIPRYHDKKYLSDVKCTRLMDERNRKVREPDQQQAMAEGASSFINPSLEYAFMLKGFSTITTSGSGFVNSDLLFDPSSAGYNFAEYADLAALFSEVRLDSVRVTMLTTNWSQSTSPIEIATMAAGIDPEAQGAPGGFGAVISLADGKFVNGQMSSSHGTTYHYRFSGNSWSPTSTVVTTPYAGCPGSFKIYGANYPNTTQVAYVTAQFVYSFRCRQ